MQPKTIPVIEGDLLDCPAGINILAHSANTENIFGAGIAKQIKQRYYNAYLMDKAAKEEGSNVLGNFSYASINYNLLIFNLYIQSLKKLSDFGIPTCYKALSMALLRLEGFLKLYSETQDIVLGFPFMMCCGLGGGDWEKVDELISEVFKFTNYPIYYVKLKN